MWDLPLWGNWYPKTYENSAQFNKTMGIQTLCKWLFLIPLTLSAGLLQEQSVFLQHLYDLGGVFLFAVSLIFIPLNFLEADESTYGIKHYL